MIVMRERHFGEMKREIKGAVGLSEPAKSGPALRIDKLLWYLRLAKSRTLAQQQCEQGHIRINGRRVDRAHSAVRAGDILTLPWQGDVRVIRIEHLPSRRGPAPEAQACYEELRAGSAA